jgi:hypothetical protein
MSTKKIKNISANQISFYQSLNRLKPNELKHIINHLNEDGINSICECIYNIIYTDLHLNKRKKKILKTHIKTHCCLKNLKIITNKKYNILTKKKALLKEGKGIGLILSTLSPLLTNLLGNIITKNA